jgi:ankyrin repeat protein
MLVVPARLSGKSSLSLHSPTHISHSLTHTFCRTRVAPYLLLPMTDPNHRLFEASIAGDVTRIQAALSAGADVNAQHATYKNYTALHYAAENGRDRALSYLLDRRANPNVNVDSFGHTPLHHACIKGHQSIVRTLVDRGADVQTPNRFGTTSLFFAASNGSLGIVDLLLQRHANPNAVGHHGNTPLHRAIVGAHQTIIKALVDAGADINILNACRTYLLLESLGAVRGCIGQSITTICLDQWYCGTGCQSNPDGCVQNTTTTAVSCATGCVCVCVCE